MVAKGRGRMDEVCLPPLSLDMANPADEIVSAQALLRQGAITQAQFDQLKQRALAGS
jgi:hypothetical protein